MTDLLDRYADLRAATSGLRPRDAAKALGVSEGTLLAARAAAGEVRPLAPTRAGFRALVERLAGVGRIMTLTRNETAVHETHGAVAATAFQGPVGQATGPIDLRIFLRHWQAGFHVADGDRESLQVFDAAGDSVIKVYAGAGTDRAAWDALVAAHLGGGAPAFGPRAAAAADRPDAEIDVDALRDGWRSLGHTHDFFGLLSRLGVGRHQALRLGGPDLATPLDPGAVARLLTRAAGSGVPIMCFVGNPGCLQIHSGPIATVAPMGPWLNILDPDFNLHLRQDQVARVWAVRKPTTGHGLITSVELFDAADTLVCQFFGVRAEGGDERADWRALVAELAAEVAA